MNNSIVYHHLSHVGTRLIKRLKPTLITKVIPRSIVFYLLNVLLFDNDSEMVCDNIYISIFLNQLQCLIIKEILHYVIKNKNKIYLESNQELSIYIRGKNRIRKNGVVKTIEIDFILLKEKIRW